MEQRSFDKSLPNLKKPFRALPPFTSEFPSSKNLIKSTDFASQSPNLLPQLRTRASNLSNPASREQALNSSGSLLTEVERDVASMDLNARMRDLEHKFLDFKSNFEKRVLIMLEENPQKYLRHIKSLEDKDAALWKEVFSKQEQFSSETRENKHLLQKQGREFFEKLLEIETKVQDLQQKSRESPANEGALAVYSEALARTAINSQSSAANPLEIELKLLKEGLSQEQLRRDSVYKDLISLYKELNLLVHKHEHELFERFSQQKAEISQELASSKDEAKRFGAFKAEIANNEAQVLRAAVAGLEKRVSQETERRVLAETELKQAISAKIAGFVDENVRNEKNLLENGHKSLKNVQESLSSLAMIIKSNKETLQAELASLQTSTNENFKTLSKTVDFLREGLNSRVFAVENALKEQTLGFSGVLQENCRKIEEFHCRIAKETQRNERILAVFEEKLKENQQEVCEKLRENLKNQENWKKAHENKSQEIFKEIQAIFKGFREETAKTREETQENLCNLSRNQANFSENHKKLLKNLEEKLDSSQNAWEYRFKELIIAKERDLAENERKLAEKAEELQKSAREVAEKLVNDNIYSLNHKLSLDFRREIDKTQENLAQNLEKNRENWLMDLCISEKKAEKAAKIVREELVVKSMQNFKQIQEISEKLRDFQEKNHEKLKEIGINLEEKSLFLRNSFENRGETLRNELKDLVISASERQIRDLRGILARNSEETAKKLQNFEVLQEKSLESRDFAIKAAVKGEFSKELREIEQKLEFFEKNLENTKEILLENVEKRAESTKSLCKALIFEETAKREKALDDLLSIVRRNLESLEKLLDSRVQTLESALRTEFSAKMRGVRADLQEFVRKLEEKLQETREFLQKSVDSLCAEVLWDRILARKREEELAKTVQNVEIRIIKGEETAKTLKSRVFFEIASLCEQVKGNREVLCVNSRKIKEIIESLKDFIENTEKMAESIERNREEIEENSRNIKENADNIKENADNLKENAEKIARNSQNINKITEELDNNQANLYEIDEKLSKTFEKISCENGSLNYLQDLYSQLQTEQFIETDTYFRSKISKTSYQIAKIMEKIQENDRVFEEFENKTDNNFQISEQVIKAHTRFLNEIDARLTLEELFNKVCHRGLEESLRKSFEILNKQVESLEERQNQGFSGNLKENLEMIRELRDFQEKSEKTEQKFWEILRKHASFLNEIDARLFCENLVNCASFSGMELRFSKEIAEVQEEIKVLAEQNLGNLEDKMTEMLKKIEEDTIPHTILQMDETMQKINNKAMSLTEELARRTKILEEKAEQQVQTAETLHTNQKDLEANILLNSTIQRASEKNIMEYCREGFEKIKEVLKELENVTIEQQEGAELEEVREDIQLLLNKINELQTELNEVRDAADFSGKKGFSQQIGELEKRLDAKIGENKASFLENNKKSIDILAKLQVEFEKLKSQIYVNRGE